LKDKKCNRNKNQFDCSNNKHKDQSIYVPVCLGPTSTSFLSILTGMLMEKFAFGFKLDARKYKKGHIKTFD